MIVTSWLSTSVIGGYYHKLSRDSSTLYSIVTLDIHITPRTADDTDQQFVYVNVTMELSKQVCKPVVG